MHWNRGRRAGIVVCVVIAAVTGGLAAAAHLVNGVTPFFKAPPPR